MINRCFRLAKAMRLCSRHSSRVRAAEFQARSQMSKQYKIGFNSPPGYNPGEMFKKLPSPIHRQTMTEIYNYRIGPDGFYFGDHLVDRDVASQAFKLFVDEALKHSTSVQKPSKDSGAGIRIFGKARRSA